MTPEEDNLVCDEDLTGLGLSACSGGSAPLWHPKKIVSPLRAQLMACVLELASHFLHEVNTPSSVQALWLSA